jgi:ATP synthase F1 complex assembly factor 2
MRIPLSKPHLAHALALEWDALLSAQQATKQHLIPLTSLTCRAFDIAADDARPNPTIRPAMATVLLRYLDTDSLLCFAPPPPDPLDPSLRPLQEQVYHHVTSYLIANLWPGVSIVPVLDGTSLFPAPQPAGTREVVQGWVLGLTPFELAGLERAALAGKSLLAAARLVAEWSEEGAGGKKQVLKGAQEGKGEKFGVDEAARAVSLEVDWQTRKWGEVEDTHDVEREDLRRQLGSVVLLVSGDGTAAGVKR